MSNKKILVWLTRHEIVPEMREFFEAHGYTIKYIPKDKLTFKSGQHAWELANEIAGRPLTNEDAVYAIMGTALVQQYLECCGDVPMIRGVFNITKRTPEEKEHVWVYGKFIQTIYIKVVTSEWKP